jgi:vacuolar protein sorting-associated protein 35
MDRLSAYAQREAETETPEQRQKTEEESIAQLLEKMRIASEKKPAEAETESARENGDAPESSDTQDNESAASSITAVSIADTETTETESDQVVEKRRGIPSNIKLFEIFNEQVQTLVKLQRMPIQDTIGLLVSLANLAL